MNPPGLSLTRIFYRYALPIFGSLVVSAVLSAVILVG